MAAQGRVLIDLVIWAMVWAAYSCSMELLMNHSSEKARQYLTYFMHRINLLRHYEVIPVVVFDGGNLPCKAATVRERRRIREENYALAKEKLDQGDTTAALDFFQRAVNITPEMAHQLIQILRQENVEFVVAPYEADAQLAYMSRLEADQEGISTIITEDSDLIAYGCQSIVFKMDRYGNGEEINADNIFNSSINGISFRHFDAELFTGMCVLAGCDFLSSVPGIGIKKAYNLVAKYRNLDRALSVLKVDKKQDMPQDYVESFERATAVFHHARIYDLKSKSLRLMKPLSEKLQQSLSRDLDILGPDLPHSIATSIAEGNLNPITMKAYGYPMKVDYRLKKSPTKARKSRTAHSRQESGKKEIRFTEFSAADVISQKSIGKEEAVISSIKYSNEAIALGKLLAPPIQRKTITTIEETFTIPDNNPFKKRKVKSTIDSCPLQSAEQDSTVTLLESSQEFPSESPGSQESVKSTSVAKHPTKRVSDVKAMGGKIKFKDMGKKDSILKFFPPIPS